MVQESVDARVLSAEAAVLDLGGLVFLQRCSTQASTSPRQHQGRIDNLSKGRSGLGNVLPPALLKLPIAICPRNFCKYDALAEAADNPLWDEVGICSEYAFQPGQESGGREYVLSPGVEAAVMLQNLLDIECGGWANTFG